MELSKFGQKLAMQSGIGQLMDDLGAARAGGREVIRPFYEKKAHQVLEQIRRCFKDVEYHVRQPEGAFFVWMWFPNLPITNQQLYKRLKRRGVVIVPGHYFFPGLTEPWPHANECIRVNYAQDEEVVSAGIQIIAEETKRARG